MIGFKLGRARGAHDRRRPRRKFVLGLVAALALLGVMSSGAAVSGSFEVVSFYPEGAPDYDNIVQISKSFESTHPGTEVKITFGGGAGAPNIAARWRAGNPPEVNVGFYGKIVGTEDYLSKGLVYDLTKAMNQPVGGGYGKKVKWKDVIVPAARKYITVNGHIYAVPREITVLNFFYNRSIFDKYKLKVPETWSDFLAVSAKLKQNGVTPLTVTGTFAGYMQMYFDYLLARRAGVAPVNQAIAGKRDFSSVPGALAAANDLQTLVKRKYFLDGFQATDFTAAQINFFQGKAAMILMGSWLVGEMKDSIPPNFQLGTFPFPSIPSGKGNDVLLGSINSWSVAAKSKNPLAGVEWLRWFSRKDVQKARTKFLDYISAFKGVPGGPKYSGIVKQLQTGGAFSPAYFDIYGKTQAVRDAYQQPIVKLFFGKISAAQLVAEITSGLKSAK